MGELSRVKDRIIEGPTEVERHDAIEEFRELCYHQGLDDARDTVNRVLSTLADMAADRQPELTAAVEVLRLWIEDQINFLYKER
jgi:hypothetical protein